MVVEAYLLARHFVAFALLSLVGLSLATPFLSALALPFSLLSLVTPLLLLGAVVALPSSPEKLESFHYSNSSSIASTHQNFAGFLMVGVVVAALV